MQAIIGSREPTTMPAFRKVHLGEAPRLTPENPVLVVFHSSVKDENDAREMLRDLMSQADWVSYQASEDEAPEPEKPKKKAATKKKAAAK